MGTQTEVGKIVTRFEIDCNEILAHVTYVDQTCKISFDEVLDFRFTMILLELPAIEVPNPHPTRRYLVQDEILHFVKSTAEARPLLESTLTRLEQEVARIQFPDLPFEYDNLIAEWREFILDNLPSNPGPEDYDWLVNNFSVGGDESEGSEDDPISTSDRALIMQAAVCHAKRSKLESFIKSIRKLLVRSGQLEAICKLVGENSVVGILRQSFILLMTAFDAVVFDLVRIKFKKDFFQLLGAFKKNKISFEGIAAAGNFDVLASSIVDEQLKSLYIKDLLFCLRDEWQVDLVEKNQKFERLIEMVLRRNIHVHNRGVVDQRYLDERKNLDCLKLNEVAKIDEAYWNDAVNHCKSCVQNVGRWAAT